MKLLCTSTLQHLNPDLIAGNSDDTIIFANMNLSVCVLSADRRFQSSEAINIKVFKA